MASESHGLHCIFQRPGRSFLCLSEIWNARAWHTCSSQQLASKKKEYIQRPVHTWKHQLLWAFSKSCRFHSSSFHISTCPLPRNQSMGRGKEFCKGWWLPATTRRTSFDRPGDSRRELCWGSTCCPVARWSNQRMFPGFIYLLSAEQPSRNDIANLFIWLTLWKDLVEIRLSGFLA